MSNIHMQYFILILSIAVISFSQVCQAANIDTILVHSQAMNQDIPAIVITPEGYTASTRLYPTIYLLHGYSGNYTDWTTKATVVTGLADQHEVIVVCPDGGYNSWYIDSPIDPASQYEAHITQEVMGYVDANYRTVKQKTGRAITGLSMGGHGALFLAIRHQDLFGAAGSMSGGVNLTYDLDAWEIHLKLGKYEENPLRWDSLSIVNMVDQVEADSLPMIIDCGVDDFFIEINRKLHQELLKSQIPHDYIERPGQHNWDYWNNAIKYQVLFFRTYFDQNVKAASQGILDRNPSSE